MGFKLHLGKPVRVLLLLACILAAGMLLCRGPGGLHGALRRDKLVSAVDHQTYLVHLPDGLMPGKKYPLVFALSPVGSAGSMLPIWSAVSEKHKWIIAASKVFRNGQPFDTMLPELEAELLDVESRYPVDPARVVFTGISGGGMGAHAVSEFFPAQVRAVVINTGMMHEALMTEDYPAGKLAVFLASPTDFRFDEMKRDRAFLERHDWETKWIEFAGGHTCAPAEAYEQAAAWLADKMG